MCIRDRVILGQQVRGIDGRVQFVGGPAGLRDDLRIGDGQAIGTQSLHQLHLSLIHI